MIRRLLRKLLKLFYYKKLVKNLLQLPFKQHIYNSNSYYPEIKSKGKYSRFCDQLFYILKYGEASNFYFLYGFDVKDRNEQSKYLFYNDFRKQRNKLNLNGIFFKKDAEHFNYIALLRDKFYFSQLLEHWKIPCPKNYYFINGASQTYIDLKTNENYPLDEIINLDVDCFCKLIIGECGNGVFPLTIKNKQIYINSKQFSLHEFCELVKNGNFLLQETIIQNKEISKIYPSSINTLRIITCIDKNGHCICLDGAIRVGVSPSRVDNWAAGGLAISVSDDGLLSEYGFYEFNNVEGRPGKVSEHPDSKVVFKNYRIPFYKEAVSECLKLHKMLYCIPTIGWDVAITENGPCFIEGNDNYEISLNQTTSGGLKDKWNSIFK